MSTGKIDLKKELKELYQASAKAVKWVEVPRLTFLSVEGKGDPNTSQEYAMALEALFGLAYKIKFLCKKELGRDFVVMPLEGQWWAEDMADFTASKNNWLWKMGILQPDFVTGALFERAAAEVAAKKDLPALENIKLEQLEEGKSAQILHIGPYADEGPTIKKLHDFIHDGGYSFDGLVQKHHEIYLSDVRKTAPEKLKTILRQPVGG